MLAKYHLVDFLACVLLDNAEAIQEPLNLAPCQADCGAFAFLRPSESPVMEPFLIEPCPVIVDLQDFYAVLIPSAEDE